jgi:hypothetical protein
MAAWASEVRSDVLRVLQQLQAIVSFQLAGALQRSLDVLLSAPEQVGVLVLLWLSVRGAARVWKADVAVARSVLVVQAGQSVLRALSAASGWAAGSAAEVAVGFLANTFALCLPSLLAVVVPRLVATDYVQNAISVYLFQYATASRELLLRVDFGVSPAVFCVLALALSGSVRAGLLGAAATRLYEHVFQAWHMLLVDWLLRAVAADAAGLPQQLQIALLLMIVIFVDELGLARVGALRDVRGYTVFRVAGALQLLGALATDSTGSLAAAMLVLCARTVLRILRVHSRVLDSVSDIVFVACVNVLLADVTSDSRDPRDYDAELLVLRVAVVSILAHGVHALLVPQREAEQ